jgi:hypothetical protein
MGLADRTTGIRYELRFRSLFREGRSQPGQIASRSNGRPHSWEADADAQADMAVITSLVENNATARENLIPALKELSLLGHWIRRTRTRSQ